MNNNDLEYFESNNIENNLKCIFLKIIREDIPSTKKTAIVYLDNMFKEVQENVTDIYGFISNKICTEIILDLKLDLSKIKIKK